MDGRVKRGGCVSNLCERLYILVYTLKPSPPLARYLEEQYSNTLRCESDGRLILSGPTDRS